MIDPHNGVMPQPDRPINKPTLPNQGDGPVLHGRPVSMPDIVFQIVLPVPQDAVATLTSTVQATFSQAVVTLAQGQILSQGVNAACTWIGIWTQGSIASEGQRQQLLTQNNFLTPVLTFGVFLNATFIQSQAAAAFASMPKQFNPTTNAADPNGSVHLTGLSVLFPSTASSTITTQITAYSTQTIPSTDLTLTLTDTLGTTTPPGGTVTVTSSSSVSASFAALDTATLISLIGSVLIGFPLFLTVPLAFAAEDIAARSQVPTSSSSTAGVGPQLVRQFPAQVLFTTLQKLSFTYTSVVVGPVGSGNSGIIARGQFAFNARVPRITSIAGPDTLFIDENLTASYHAMLEDFLSTVRCTWSTDEQIISQTPATTQVQIVFPDPGTTGRSHPPYTGVVHVSAAEPPSQPGASSIPNPPATAQKTVSLVYRHTPPSGHQGQDSGEDLSHSAHHH